METREWIFAGDLQVGKVSVPLALYWGDKSNCSYCASSGRMVISDLDFVSFCHWGDDPSKTKKLLMLSHDLEKHERRTGLAVESWYRISREIGKGVCCSCFIRWQNETDAYLVRMGAVWESRILFEKGHRQSANGVLAELFTGLGDRRESFGLRIIAQRRKNSTLVSIWVYEDKEATSWSPEVRKRRRISKSVVAYEGSLLTWVQQEVNRVTASIPKTPEYEGVALGAPGRFWRCALAISFMGLKNAYRYCFNPASKVAGS